MGGCGGMCCSLVATHAEAIIGTGHPDAHASLLPSRNVVHRRMESVVTPVAPTPNAKTTTMTTTTMTTTMNTTTMTAMTHLP